MERLYIDYDVACACFNPFVDLIVVTMLVSMASSDQMTAFSYINFRAVSFSQKKEKERDNNKLQKERLYYTGEVNWC